MLRFNYHSCPTFMTFHEFIAVVLNCVKVLDLCNTNQSSIDTNRAIYITHTKLLHNSQINYLYTAYLLSHTDTINSHLTASHTATFTHKQNINTPNHLLCTTILIQFRKWTKQIQTRLSQHPSVGPSPWHEASSVCGCRTPPVSQSVSRSVGCLS